MRTLLQKAEETLFFLCLLFLPTQLGKHFFLDFSYIFSLPVDYLSPTIYFWDLLALGLLGVWFVKKPQINKLALNLLLLFLLTQLLSLVFAVNVFAGVFRIEQLLISGMFGVYLASQKLNIKRILLPFLLGVLLESLIAIAEFLLGRSLNLWILGERSFNLSTPVIAKFNFFQYIFLRPYATFPHPNVLAAYLLIALPFVALLKNLKLKWFLTFLTAGAVVITFSRVAALLLIFYALPFFRQRLKLFAILALIITPLIFIRFVSVFNFDNLSILRREELSLVAFKAFFSSPILGIGANNFINFVSSSTIISGPTRFLQPVHNIFLLLLSETGVIGFLGFLVFASVAIRKVWKYRDTLFKPLIFGWIVIIFFGMFDHFFLTLPQGQRLMFFVWGLSLGIYKKQG